jgi:heptaprenyl diphosphate synthase
MLMDVAEILGGRSMRGDLARVELVLGESCRCERRFLTELSSVLARAGGKRLRPALVLALAVGDAAEAPPAPADAVTAAVAVELLHLGTLYHDDVLDEAATRRGTASANARAGNVIAVLAGDVLLARSIVLASTMGQRPAQIVARALDLVCQGQALETDSLYDPHRTVEGYWESIGGKTAALLAACCQLGAVLAGFDEPTVDAVRRYGHHLGMAFQVADDVLDLVGSEAVVGKPVGSDLVEGVFTLPVLLARAGDPTIAELLTEPDGRRRAAAVGPLVVASGAVGAALATGEHEARSATAALWEADELDPVVRARLSRFADEVVAAARSACPAEVLGATPVPAPPVALGTA